MKSIYYGLWAQMLNWSVTQRAAVVLGLVCIIFYLFLTPIFMRLLSLGIRLLDLVLKGIYSLINLSVEAMTRDKSIVEKAGLLNPISMRMGRMSERLCALSLKAKAKKRLSLLTVFAIYGVLILLIGLPDWMGNKINPQYLPIISQASKIYQGLEEPTLRQARLYPPLFVEEKKAVAASAQPVTAEAEEEEELWLSLSNRGKGGANVREKPTTKSRAVTAISGDTQVMYLGEQENGWVFIQLESGEQGWINGNLLEGVPEDDKAEKP